jgi:nucleoside 2-deoxyribosyltransferase
MLVYLAGPITGLSYGETTDWRQQAIDFLKDHGIQGLSPMRHKDYLLQETSIGDSYEQSVMSSQRGIYARDYYDCHRCDGVLVNLLGAKRTSIGTVMEIAWAAQVDIPIILAMEDQENIHEHPIIREACPFRVNNFEDALHLTVSVIAPSYYKVKRRHV